MKRVPPGEEVTVPFRVEDATSYVPPPLPPKPAIQWTTQLTGAFDEAMLALGRLDAALPAQDPPLGANSPDVARSADDPPLDPEGAPRLFGDLAHREAVLAVSATAMQVSYPDLLMHAWGHTPDSLTHYLTEDPTQNPATNIVTAVERTLAATELGRARLTAGRAPTSDLMKEVHAVLVGEPQRLRYGGSSHLGEPGEFRRTLLWPGLLNRGPRPNMRVPPQYVQGCMEALDDFLNDRQGGLNDKQGGEDQAQATPGLLKTALAHMQFGVVYPFADEGPRTNLVQTTLLLQHTGLVKEPPLQLSEQIIRNHNHYLQAGENVRLEGDWEAWLSLFARMVTDAANATIDLIRRLTNTAHAEDAAVKNLGRASTSAHKVLTALRSQRIANSGRLQELTELNATSVNAMLDRLVDLKIATEITGYRKHRIFRYEGAYRELVAGTEGLRTAPPPNLNTH